MDVHHTAGDSNGWVFILDNGVRFFPGRRYITDRTGAVINLTENSYRFFTLLLKGETDKQSIISQVWCEQRGAVSDSSYYGQIHFLRKMLAEVGISGAVIKTLPRRGVKYMGKVDVMPEDSVTSSTSDSVNKNTQVQEIGGEGTNQLAISDDVLQENLSVKTTLPLQGDWINSRNFNVLITIVAILSVCWLSTLVVVAVIVLK